MATENNNYYYNYNNNNDDQSGSSVAKYNNDVIAFNSRKRLKHTIYIRIMKHAPNFRGQRESIDVSNLDLKQLSPQGLILSLFSRTNLGRGKPTTNELCLKYYGYLDLDLDIDSLTQSACSPFNVCFESRNEAKLAIVEQIKQHGLQAFIGMCPLFKRLYDAVNVITEELGQCVSFFTGGKGFRILWFDPKLYHTVYYRDQSDYAKHLIQNIFPLYFKCWDTFSEYVDEQPYQNAKGIKVDIDKNVKTGLYPCTLLNEPTTLDPSLVSNITDF